MIYGDCAAVNKCQYISRSIRKRSDILHIVISLPCRDKSLKSCHVSVQVVNLGLEGIECAPRRKNYLRLSVRKGNDNIFFSNFDIAENRITLVALFSFFTLLSLRTLRTRCTILPIFPCSFAKEVPGLASICRDKPIAVLYL